MRLWIAEKPSVASDIVKALGGGFTRHDGYAESSTDIVSFCVGHVLEMVPPEVINPAYATWSLDTLPLKLYPVQLQVKENVARQANALIRLIKRPDIKTVVHCGDPDDEGQLLVDEVLEFAGNTAPVKRALINDNTAPAVKKAITNLKDNKEFRGMYLKALARSVGDAIFGFSMSRCYSIKAREKGYKGVLSVGRVQTPVLALIVRRWRENKDHTASFYYSLTGNFIKGTDVISARWQTSESAPVDDKKRLNDKKWADGLAKALAGKSATVLAAAVDTGKTTAAPLPFSLDSLQKYMHQTEKLTLQQTLDITQKLRDTYKAITYNRSDCTYLSDEQFSEAPQLVEALKSLNAFSALDTDTTRKSSAFNSNNISAHTAIIPTLNVPDMAKLTPNEKAVYLAIAKFYLVQFLAKKTFDEAIAEIKCGDESFKVSARKTTDSGFTSFLGDDKDEDEPDDNSGAFDVLSRLRTGESLTCRDVSIAENKTKPKPLFTEGTLLAAMINIADHVADPRIKQLLKEKDKGKKKNQGGIGTPATRAAIIETLKKRNYVTIKKGKFEPTEAGLSLIDALPDSVTQADMTAVWSERQAAIETGQLTIEKFIDGLYGEVTRLVESAEINISASENPVQKTALARLSVNCPSCNSQLVMTAKSCACTGCKFKIWLDFRGKKLTQKQIETIIGKGKSGEIKGFKSKKTDSTYSMFVTLKNKETGELGFEYPSRDDSKSTTKNMPRELKL
ncbi:type IA DNA topoisomerase [Salmonella enterica]|uniref:DNA topoisomerase n=1 Tax=Salmonella enterica subsp. enterica serovar Rubislaw str. ATCC 10717 TaxID=938143 RepID=A0A6W0P2X9_SALRU|nr:type IA DNA topoisomerase [Salmonella enterica]EBY1810953.1 type IA DNA topoisomerase [Salmonella enterica subsp. enterica serovar Rubislaw]HAA1128152.1 type IA DNA topoisomerase [Salmonella enterica subsp. enterica serovar Rubislaw str. ATCC 10717]EAY7317690.1 type IA DNA topoisomerase [Salmonella enterica]EBA2968982.1 type IA DNA topoisomerase [Salmonella enterica]